MAEPLRISPPRPLTPAADAAPALRLVAPPPPRGAKWLDLETAHKRSGIAIRTLRRRCGEEWLALGLAELSPRANGRPPQWLVREDADPALTLVRFPEQLPFDPRQLPGKTRDVVCLRKRIMDDWARAVAAARADGSDERSATKRFIDAANYGIVFSRATLFNWRREYRARGLEGLLDRRNTLGAPGGDGRGGVRGGDPFLDEVKRLYLQTRRLRLSSCHQMASSRAAEEGWPTRSYEVCRRHVKAIPAAVLYKFRFGEEAFVNEAEPYIERDYSSLSSNQIWCGDHHRFDVIVKHEGRHLRPWLTAWQDLRSRKIVGWQIFAGDPDTNTILAAFADGARTHGIPESVYIDNGKDFDSFALQGRTKRQRRQQIEPERAQGLFAMLDVKVIHCRPYHGQSKPIERFFGTVEQITRAWDTYCGNTPDNKPEGLAERIKRGKSPPLDEFTKWFSAWLQTYHGRAHHGDAMGGKSPNEVYEENLKRKRAATPEQLDVLLLKVVQPVKVGQNGVRYKGVWFGAGDSALLPYLGKEVYLRIDPKEVSHVDVWTLDDRFVCRAASNRRLPWGTTDASLDEAHARKTRTKKLASGYLQIRPRMHRPLEEYVIEAASKAPRPAPESAGTDSIPIKTPIDDQLSAVQRRGERRLRIGPDTRSKRDDFLDFAKAVRPKELEPRPSEPALRDVMQQLKEGLAS